MPRWTSFPPDEDPNERIARVAHQIGRVPTWILARELGVTVDAIERYEERFGVPDPLRPSTWRRR